MRTRLASTTLCKTIPVPQKSYETTFLWVEEGAYDTTTHILHSYRTTEDPDVLDITQRSVHGSFSKVYHAEPVRVTWYSDTLWREETPHSDTLFEFVRTDRVPQNAAPNKCGSPKS